MSAIQELSKITLISNRTDVIRFVEYTCEPVVPMKVLRDIPCGDFLPSVDYSVTIFDISILRALNIPLQKNQKPKNFFEQTICLVPVDVPKELNIFAEENFKYIVPFPVSVDTFRVLVARFQNLINNKETSDIPNFVDKEVVPESFFGYFCGNSDKIRVVRRQLLKVSCSKSPVLLLGETGTGKSTAAHVIHSLSSYKNKKMEECPLSTVVETLAETKFFGQVKGAYTDAEENIGVFEKADNNTLFFDELGMASLNVQAMLLKVLETGVFKKVGAQEEMCVDVRFIFATTSDLVKMMKEGQFHKALFYRICDNIIKLPPLRERKEDISDIVKAYIQKRHFKISKVAMECLQDYGWPGNIRELHKCLKYVMDENDSNMITEKDLRYVWGQHSSII